MKKFESMRSVRPSIRYNVEDYPTSVSFTEEDYLHCSNCIDLVEHLLSPDTDGEFFDVSSDDIKFLAQLLYLSHSIMGGVIEASEGFDNDI